MDISYASRGHGRAEERGKRTRTVGMRVLCGSYILSPFLPLRLSGLEPSVPISLFTSTALSRELPK